jgi:protein SDA1
LEAEKKSRNNVTTAPEDAFLTENEILGPRKKAKMDYEERMAHIQKGREGREKFGSKKGKKDKVAPSSSTNREKARNKPIMMAVHSNKVMQKKKASLRDVQVSPGASWSDGDGKDCRELTGAFVFFPSQMKLRAAADKQKKRKR